MRSRRVVIRNTPATSLCFCPPNRTDVGAPDAPYFFCEKKDGGVRLVFLGNALKDKMLRSPEPSPPASLRRAIANNISKDFRSSFENSIVAGFECPDSTPRQQRANRAGKQIPRRTIYGITEFAEWTPGVSNSLRSAKNGIGAAPASRVCPKRNFTTVFRSCLRKLFPGKPRCKL